MPHKYRRKRKVFLIASITALMLSAIGGDNLFRACAQDLDEITIAGNVTDENGALIPGASVAAEMIDANVKRTIVSDREGRYRLIELTPGAYRLQIAADDFASQSIRVEAVAGQNVTVNFTLHPKGIGYTQTINESVADAAIDVTRTLVGATIRREEIETLPLDSRAPLDFVFLLPGVSEEPFSTRDLAADRRLGYQETPEEAGGFALAGGPAYSNNITLDGFDNNDDRAARERIQPSLEAIEEVQVITNQFSAEYGRASGGRVNLRTRGGTSDWHARAFYFFRDESLNANSWAANARNLKRLPLQQHDFGLTLSGPLRWPHKYFGATANERDRTLFFFAYERDRTLDSALIDTLVPVAVNPAFPLPSPTALASRRREISSGETNDAAELAPYIERVGTPAQNVTATWRVDRTYNAAHNGNFHYQGGVLNNLRGFNGGSHLAESVQNRARRSDALAYADTYVFSPRAVAQTRLQFSRLAPRTTGSGSSHPIALITLRDSLVAGEIVDRSGTLVAGNSTLGATDRRESRIQLQETLSLLAGAHTLKLGGEGQRVRSMYVDLTDATGTYSFDSAADFLRDAPSRYRQTFGNDSAQKNLYASLFIQDEWRAQANLTVSYGVRYENETIVRDRNNWGPRFGVAYDPFCRGVTVFRFGFGAFYNRALLRTIDDFALGARQSLFDTNTLRDAATERPLAPAARRQFIAANLRFPQTLAADSPLVNGFAVRAVDFTRRLDPALRLPESYQLNIGFERQLRGRVILEVNYTRNRGAHLWREFNANAPALPRGYDDFTAYLLSRDFANFRDPRSRLRPLYDAARAGELVRFALDPIDATKPEAVARVVDDGVPMSVVNLRSVNSTTAIEIASAALRALRPDPARGEVEQLAALGNSYYQALTIEMRGRMGGGARRFALTMRAAYTLSRLVDDGAVNTSDALRVGDFRGERAASLLDRRHRFALSGTIETPSWLGRLRLSPVLRAASGAPFNISIGGADRNLDDVGNDRPNYDGDARRLRAHLPGKPYDADLIEHFALPSIGATGNLPRNAGRGPGFFMFDLSVGREFRAGEHRRLRPYAEFDNALNHTVFNFGAEYINFTAISRSADVNEGLAIRESFLTPRRSLRPRTVRFGLRLDF